MIEFGSYVADSKEKFKIFSRYMIELLILFVKTDYHTTSLFKKNSEMRPQITLIDERMAEIKDYVTKF